MDNLIADIAIFDDVTAGEPVRVLEGRSTGKKRKLYIESYGCQMNFSDSEIVASILAKEGFDTTSVMDDADLIFLNTCSIREKAEQTIYFRLNFIRGLKKHNPGLMVGLLGCMAERLKIRLLEEEKVVDLIAGPDAYRDLPRLIGNVDDGQKAANTFLSREETYGDVSPVRLNSNGVSAFISIMRGCDNMCSFCVVPFTRGRERSRDPQSIIAEARDLFERGYREVTLLGQNVDSYKWAGAENPETGKDNNNLAGPVSFAMLLELVARIDPNLRVRFSTSHPKDITEDVLFTMAGYENICKNIHLPLQSGNDRVLSLMNRGYTTEWYLEKVKSIKMILGDDCGISSDMIAGFCSETEEEHQHTLEMMDRIEYDFAYMFYYSERPGTPAAKKLKDDVPLETKKRRLDEIIIKQRIHSSKRNHLDVGKVHRVLIEGFSKRSDNDLQGRTSANKVIVFPKRNKVKGEYVNVHVTQCTGGTLIGEIQD